MKSSKWILGLTAIMLVLVLAPSSFAQVNLTVSNTASTTEVLGGRTAQSSDPNSPGAGITVSGALLANSALTTTQLVLTFPVAITSGAAALDGTMGGTATNLPAGDAIQISGQTGLFAGLTAISTINYNAGTITITLPGTSTGPANTNSGSFRIIGTRLDLTSKSAGVANLTLSSIRLDNVGGSAGSGNANNYNLNTTGSSVALITNITNGIGGFTQAAATGGTNNGTAAIFSNQTGATFADATATLVLTEGFVNAWRTKAQSSISGTSTGYSDTGVRLTITGLPSGVTATLSTDGTNTPASSFSTTTLVGTTTQSTISFTASQIAAIDTVGIQVVLSGTPAAGSLTVGNTITLKAEMAPVATAGNTTAGIPQGPFPRFDSNLTSAVTIANIISAQTTMLIPYATKSANFNVAIAISNTTTDPFGTVAQGSATKVAGGLNIYFFPTTSTGAAGTMSQIVTSSSVRPGSGLSSDGTLASGATWTADLASLLAAATPAITTDFTGYIFIQTNFLDAHGLSYLVTTGIGGPTNVAVTGATLIEILDPPAAVSRTNGGATAKESLGF